MVVVSVQDFQNKQKKNQDMHAAADCKAHRENRRCIRKSTKNIIVSSSAFALVSAWFVFSEVIRHISCHAYA